MAVRRSSCIFSPLLSTIVCHIGLSFRRFQDSYRASASVVFGAENLSMADELRNALEAEDGAWGKYWLLQSGTQHSRDNKEAF